MVNKTTSQLPYGRVDLLGFVGSPIWGKGVFVGKTFQWIFGKPHQTEAIFEHIEDWKGIESKINQLIDACVYTTTTFILYIYIIHMYIYICVYTHHLWSKFHFFQLLLHPSLLFVSLHGGPWVGCCKIEEMGHPHGSASFQRIGLEARWTDRSAKKRCSKNSSSFRRFDF